MRQSNIVRLMFWKGNSENNVKDDAEWKAWDKETGRLVKWWLQLTKPPSSHSWNKVVEMGILLHIYSLKIYFLSIYHEIVMGLTSMRHIALKKRQCAPLWQVKCRVQWGSFPVPCDHPGGGAGPTFRRRRGESAKLWLWRWGAED